MVILNFEQWIIMTSYILLRLLINSNVWSTRRRWVNMENPNMFKLQFINAGSCLPIFYPDIWDTHNKRKSPHDRKESVYIVEEVTESEASKELPMMWLKYYKAKRQIRQNAQNPYWSSGGFVYSVTPCLQVLDHTSHENV